MSKQNFYLDTEELTMNADMVLQAIENCSDESEAGRCAVKAFNIDDAAALIAERLTPFIKEQLYHADVFPHSS